MGDFPEALYSISGKGWMEKDVFLCFLNDLNTYLDEQHISKPIVLFMDGHASHLTLQAAEFCAEHQILLYCLPAHLSHILQPLDVGVFSSMKEAWGKEVRKWQKKHPGVTLQKINFQLSLSQSGMRRQLQKKLQVD